tara:strand:- start:2358 stop:2510 length:153 start_codon:yes stop_codon:yes gene_type:complete
MPSVSIFLELRKKAEINKALNEIIIKSNKGLIPISVSVRLKINVITSNKK